jgi:uncharacterized protein (TIGR02145 family)
LDSEGEPISPKPKKKINKKIILLVIVILAIVGIGTVYFLFLNKGDNQTTSVENAEVAENKEVEVDKNLDTDNDGLPDYLEKVLGTDINNSDTDGDSYGDYEEIKNGYDPLSDKKFTDEEWEAVKEIIKNEEEKLYGEMFENSVVNSNNTGTNDFVCGTSIVKDIDNNIYNTVKIGDQCWLKENLKVTKNPTGEAITRHCYDNDPSICETDGGLYDWDTAMNGSITEGTQGICPNGWHIPKDSEWYILENGLAFDPCSSTRSDISCSPAGTKLKQRGFVGSSEDFNFSGISGFMGILAGERNVNERKELYGLFSSRGQFANFWSSTEENKIDAWYRYFYLLDSTVGRYTDNKAQGYSVRCIKD